MALFALPPLPSLNKGILGQKDMEEEDLEKIESLKIESLHLEGWPTSVVEKFLSRQELAKGPVIVVDNLSKAYNGNAVLKGFTLNVFEKEIFGIVGVSGSGKTTLLEAMVGLVHLDKGRVSIKDPKTGQLKSVAHDQSLRWWMGFSPQVASVYPELTVRENLDMFGLLLDMPSSRILSRIDSLSGFLDLHSVLDKRVSTLSRGLQKKADIACALLNDPQVLILDEPVRDLDPISRKEIYHALKSINASGTTIVVSSHAIEELAGVCHRMGVLHQGSLVRSLRPSDMSGGFYEITFSTDTKQYLAYKERLEQAAIPVRIQSGSLMVHTTEPELVIRFLMDSAQAVNEKIKDLRVTKPKAEDLFAGWVSA